MTINATLLNVVADVIEAAPQKYDQSVWLHMDREDKEAGALPETGCGTTACIAGWAFIKAHEAGLVEYAFEYSDAYRHGDDGYVYGRILSETEADGYGRIFTKGLQYVAADLLNLPDAWEDVLFDTSWQPKPGMTVPDALRALANGADLRDVTNCQELRYYAQQALFGVCEHCETLLAEGYIPNEPNHNTWCPNHPDYVPEEDDADDDDDYYPTDFDLEAPTSTEYSGG